LNSSGIPRYLPLPLPSGKNPAVGKKTLAGDGKEGGVKIWIWEAREVPSRRRKRKGFIKVK
jgi:hypothetical protein